MEQYKGAEPDELSKEPVIQREVIANSETVKEKKCTKKE